MEHTVHKGKKTTQREDRKQQNNKRTTNGTQEMKTKYESQEGMKKGKNEEIVIQKNGVDQK